MYYFLGENNFSCMQCHTFSLPSFTKLMIFYRTNWFFIYKDLIIPNFLKKKTANLKTKQSKKPHQKGFFPPGLLCLKNTWEHEYESATLRNIPYLGPVLRIWDNLVFVSVKSYKQFCRPSRPSFLKSSEEHYSISLKVDEDILCLLHTICNNHMYQILAEIAIAEKLK